MIQRRSNARAWLAATALLAAVLLGGYAYANNLEEKANAWRGEFQTFYKKVEPTVNDAVGLDDKEGVTYAQFFDLCKDLREKASEQRDELFSLKLGDGDEPRKAVSRLANLMEKVADLAEQREAQFRAQMRASTEADMAEFHLKQMTSMVREAQESEYGGDIYRNLYENSKGEYEDQSSKAKDSYDNAKTVGDHADQLEAEVGTLKQEVQSIVDEPPTKILPF